MDNKKSVRRLATMVDCSRNAVMNPDSVKKWIDLTSDMGYNALLLYTEDTYEVDNNPYFGYMRGRYTQEELKEIDAYAVSKGMELIPCIQTLAHLRSIIRWPAYKQHVDADDILLVGDEVVYDLIENIFATIARCFTSRIVNIGMDEAYLLGRGKYYDLHGDNNYFQVVLDHLKRVAEIGKKYGFTITMWSDMFFSRVDGGTYDVDNEDMYALVRNQIPENVQLTYWQYRSLDKKYYDRILDAHARLNENTWFAGGIWTWVGFAPHNGYSMKAADASIASCKEHNISDIVMTLWGNDGGECSRYALIPALFYVAELVKGNTEKESIYKKFKEKFGISFEQFMMLDLTGTPGAVQDAIVDSEKYLLYNDCFTGLLDSTLAGGEGKLYAKCANDLAVMVQDPQWGYLFETLQALCHVLEIKAELGVRTRKIYSSRNKDALDELIADYEECNKRLEVFYEAYKRQWFSENKPHGFDVQDIRLGGLMRRIKSCMERLISYRDGNIAQIAELEEKQLDIKGGGVNMAHKPVEFKSWALTVTSNVIICD